MRFFIKKTILNIKSTLKDTFLEPFTFALGAARFTWKEKCAEKQIKIIVNEVMINDKITTPRQLTMHYDMIATKVLKDRKMNLLLWP